MVLGAPVTTGQIQGVNIMVMVDTSGGNNPTLAIGFQKSCTLNFTTATMDVTSKNSQFWTEYLPGNKDWSLDADALIVESDVSLNTLENSWIAGQGLYVALSTPANAQHWGGKVYIKSMKYTAADNGVYTATITLQGTGRLGKT
jgi:Predicted secreted protein